MPVSSMPSRGRLAVLLGALAMFGAFSIDTIFPAFPAMAADFRASKVAMQQTISIYLVAYAAMSLLHGPLSDAIGRRRVILGGVAVFVLASVGCALAPDLPTLLAFRVLQGLSAGVGLIVGRAVVRDCLDGHDAQRLMSQITMIFGIAPAIAPIIGGWILGFSDWHGIFWFLAGWGVLIFLATAAWLPETHPVAQRRPFRVAGLWHDNIAMLRNRAFLRLAFAGSFNFGALFLYIASAPAFVMDLMGLDERQFHWFFVPTITGMMLGAWTSGRLAGRISGRALASIGFGVCGLAVLLNLGYNLWVDVPRIPLAILPMMVNAFGIALVFPILTLAILDMYPRQRGAASSLQAFIGLGFNALVAGLVSPWVSHGGLPLALTAASLSLAAWVIWYAYARRAAKVAGAVPVVADAADRPCRSD